MPDSVSALVVTGADPSGGCLDETLASIRAQSYPRDAVRLIVAGGGIDAPAVGDDAEVVDVAAPSEGAAMNLALGVADGAVYVWSDDATVWYPDRIERTVRFFDDNPETDVCVCPLDSDDGGVDLGMWDRYGERIAVFLDTPFSLGALAMRRRVIDLLKRFREIDLARWELLIRSSLTGRPIGRLDGPLGRRRVTPERRVPGLRPGRFLCSFVKEHLEDLGSKDLFNHVTLRSVSDAYCVKAGLFNAHDFVTEGLVAAAEARRIGQTDNSLYWQGILLRRLSDFGASHDHLARLGAHPVLTPLREQALGLVGDTTDPDLAQLRQTTRAADMWNPLAFVELCRKCAGGNASDEAEHVAELIQAAEIDLLIDHTYQAALRQS